MQKDEYLKFWGMKIKANYIWLLVIAIFIGWFVFTKYWGFKEIGKFGEKRSYTTQYWVSLQPDNAESKNYRVKADIEREMPDYYLLKVYWPNGGSSSFDDCTLDKDEYEIKGYVHCFPTEGNNYEENGYNIRINTKDKVR